jgi:hypothetical protein
MPKTVADKIQEWFVDTMNNSVVSRNSECYEHVRRSVEKAKEADWAQGAIPEPGAAETALAGNLGAVDGLAAGRTTRKA